MKTIQLLAVAALSLAPALARAEGTDSQAAVHEEVIAASSDISASMTPAEKHHKRIEEERMRDGDHEKTPRMKAKGESASFPTQHHRDAYHSLSDKNQHAYKGLEDHEKDQVAESYRNGNNHQKTMSKILKKDQKVHNRSMKNGGRSSSSMYRHDKGNEDSPASNAMEKQSKSKAKQKNDIFG